MAIFKVTAKPDFTELKSAISGLESTPIKIDIDTTPVIAKIKATSQNLSKMTQTFDGGGRLTGAVQQYNSKLGETVQVTRRLNKETGELEVTQEKVTQNYEKVAKAAERAAQIQAKAQAAAQKAQETEANRAAAEAQKIQNVLGSMGTNIGTFSGNAAEAKEWIASLDGMSGATVKATGNVRNAAGVFQTYSAAVDGAKGTTDNFTFAINESTGEVYKLANGAVDAAKKNSLLGDSIGRVLLKMAAWQVFGDLISKVIGSFRDALNTLKDVDTEMVNVQKVTDYSNTQMKELEENAYALASAYGRTADEITAMYTAFARAGYLGDQLDSMTELGTLLANIGDISQDTASKFLLAVDAAWKLNGSESELMTVMDGLNEITNKNAVDMEALTSGITVAGSVFAEAGESAQTFSALVGAGVAATQRSGSEISRGLRTIVMNIRQIKGETEDGELIDGESIAKASKALREYAGISTMANGQLRLSSDVLKDLAEKWNSLDTVAQSAIAEALAGKRQANILTALMGNWDTVEKMMQDYADGAGSALKENEIYLDSWEAKSKQLTASWTEFVSHLVETDTIKGALDGVIGLVELLDTDVGRFVVTVVAATAGFAVLVETVKSLKGLELVKDVKAFGGVLIDAAKGAGTLSDALGLLNLKSLAVVGGIAVLVTLIMGLKQMYEATFPTAESLTASINEANEKIKTNKERLDEINNIPWNERTEAILSEKKALEEENEELEKNIELTEQRSVSAAKTALFGTEGSAAYVAGGTALGGFRPGGDSDASATAEANTKAAQEYIAVLREEGQLTDEQNVKVQDLLETMQERAAYYEILKDHSGELNANERELLDLLGQEAQSYEDLVSAYDQAAYGTEALINAYVELNNSTYITEETYQRLIGIYPQLADAATQTADGYVIQKEALENLMSAEQQQQAKIAVLVNSLIEEAQQSGKTEKELYDLVAAQITASNTKLNFSQQVAALKALSAQAGYTAQDIAAVYAFSDTSAMNQIRAAATGLMRSGKAKTSQEAMKMAKQNYIDNLWGSLNTFYKPSGGGSYVPSPGSAAKSKQNEMDNARKKAAQATIDAIKRQRDAETDAIDEQIDALKKQNEEAERGKKLEELKLNILKKQDELLNARNERTVRQYNAATGQWEWVADAEKVKQAQEALENAKKDLRDYERDTERELAIEELEARKKAIEAAYQLKIDTWQKLIDQLNGDVETEAALLAASRGDWETYYQEMLKVYQNLLDAAEDYQKKMTAIQAQTPIPGGSVNNGGNADEVNKIIEANRKKENDALANLDKDLASLTPAQRSAYDMWMSRGVGSYEAMRQAKKVPKGNTGGSSGGSTKKTTDTSSPAYTPGGTFLGGYKPTTSGSSGGSTSSHTTRRPSSGGSTSSHSTRKPSGGRGTMGGGKNTNKVSRYDSGGVLHGLGGIKATVDDEMVLPPDVTRKLLMPSSDSRAKEVIAGMRLVLNDRMPYGKSLAGVTNNSADSHDVAYYVNGVSIGADAANSMTIAQVVRDLAEQSYYLKGYRN